MNIDLYNQTDDRHVVDKTLPTATASFTNATARGEFDVRGGIITIATSTDITKCNYCYISDLARYYYITDINIVRNGLYEISLQCDVLKTFSSGIKQLTGTVTRQENKYNGYIPDNQYKELAYTQITAKAFPNGMTSDTLILMTVG